METTVQISKELLERLKSMKMHDKESYEDLIWDLIEDRMEFSEETKKNIEDYERALKEGDSDRFSAFEEVKKRLKINV